MNRNMNFIDQAIELEKIASTLLKAAKRLREKDRLQKNEPKSE
jgi:hypothetical protein